jgi:hypothetical protein
MVRYRDGATIVEPGFRHLRASAHFNRRGVGPDAGLRRGQRQRLAPAGARFGAH